MQEALLQAKTAKKNGEVPIGAVIVKDNKIIAKGSNRCITDKDPTAHAEIVAMRKAAKKLKNYRLNNCAIYTTIEPCPMCSGALINARVKKILFGALDKKAGACRSVFRFANGKKLNHQIEIEKTKGQISEDCAQIIKSFFKEKRILSDNQKKGEK
jgi:tRNA(adenine34) deaminase